MACTASTGLMGNKISVFILTFFSYAFCHAARKTFSNVKSAMAGSWLKEEDIFADEIQVTPKVPVQPAVDPFLDTVEEAEVFIGLLDTIFLLSYATGLYVCGVLGDRVNMRNLLVFGMSGSAFMMFMFGTVSEWLGYYNRIYYATFWILNGLLQGTTWPTLVAIMGNWFGITGRGFILGLWSSSASVGNIIGAFSVSMSVNQGYEYAFLTTSVMLIAWSAIVLIFLHPTPADAGISVDNNEKKETSAQTKDETEESPLTVTDGTEAIGFIEALMVPGVLVFAVSFGFLKMVHYSMLFWLPFYLTSSFNWVEAKSARLTMLYDIGGAFGRQEGPGAGHIMTGGALSGLVSDVAGRRIPVVVTMLILSIISVFGYNFIDDNEIWNGLGMTVVGFFVCGVTHMVSSVVVVDLGQQEAVRNKEALATVTGIVDGTGTVGAAIGQIVIPLLLVSSGWESVFYFLTIMLVCSTLTVLPTLLGSITSHLKSSPKESSPQ